MTLSIASIGIIATVMTGTLPYTNPQHMQEADRILTTGVYQYRDTEIYGGHDYSTFEGLENIQKGARVRIDRKLYAVTGTRVIAATDTWILRRERPMLFTCTNENKDRFITFLREL